MSEEVRETQPLRESFIQAVYELRRPSIGPSIGIAKQDQIMERIGLDRGNSEHIDLYDALAGYWVERGLLESWADGYGILKITAEGIDYVEGNSQQSAPTSVTFNVGNAYGSIFGTQQHAQILQPNFEFKTLEEEIEERGGEDTEALKNMVREIRTTLEQQESLGRRRLEGWSELINRHSWIAGPIAQLLLLYATTGQLTTS
jgi:hypothetical protein